MTIYTGSMTTPGISPGIFLGSTAKESWQRIFKSGPISANTDERSYSSIANSISENSTEQAVESNLYLICSDIEYVFGLASDEIFEDGLENNFSSNLELAIRKWSSPAVSIITNLINSGKVKGITISKALAILGYIEHAPSYYDRLWTLEKLLSSPSPRVRDGACLGLSFLDDPRAIPFIEKAIANERTVELRINLQQLTQQLENTRNVASGS